MASYTPIYQKRGEDVVPVITIDDAPSAEASAAGHLVDSNGIASALAALEAKIPSDPIDPSGFMHLTGNLAETATGAKTFTSTITANRGIDVAAGSIEVTTGSINVNNMWSHIYCNGYYGITGCNFYSNTYDNPAIEIDYNNEIHIDIAYAVQSVEIPNGTGEDDETLTVVFDGAGGGMTESSGFVITLIIDNKAGGLIIDWGDVQWPDSTPPDISTGVSVLTFLFYNNLIFGTVSGLSMGGHQ